MLDAILDKMGVPRPRDKVKNELKEGLKNVYGINSTSQLDYGQRKKYIGWVAMMASREYGIDIDNKTLEDLNKENPII